MPRTVQVQCPAKVNLFLEITGKRSNGYHTLASIFAKISLFDVIDAETTGEGLALEVADECGQPLGSGPDNLVWRAAAAFRKRFRVGVGTRLRLTKRIPMGAGLGGGSSDAAGTLTVLARLFHMERRRGMGGQLKKIALRLGADVPFFLHRGAMAEGRGIGERLKQLTTGKALPWIILVFPRLSVPTRDVYGRLIRGNRKAVLTRLSHLDKLKKKLEKGRPISEWGDLLFNRLETAVLEAHPGVRQAKRILTQAGLQAALMSGSGSSVFGFAGSRADGEKTLKRLKGYPWSVFLVSAL